MNEAEIEFYIPRIEELAYRKQLLADPSTMEYNLGYGDNPDSGCLTFDESNWQKWYEVWFNTKERYYPYILIKSREQFIGEVALRFNKDLDAYCISIIIEAKYRHFGYGKTALKKLIDIAFKELEVDKVYDEFSKNRVEAEKLFSDLGFRRVSKNIVELTRDRYLNKII